MAPGLHTDLASKENSAMKQHLRVLTMLLGALVSGRSLMAQTAADRGQAPKANASDRGLQRLTREVRHELVMLPYYGVFDNLAYRVDGSTVTLMGQVTRPTLKSDAENVVKSIEGVERVNNKIEVLPLSPNDDRIRLA